MTEELKQAAQAALEQLEFLNACYPHKTAADAVDALRRALTQRPAAQEVGEREGWTDADADAARLALELECLLLDTKDTASVSRWWASANEALDLHRARLADPQQATPEQVGEVRCEGCGYMTHHREHMGCVRAAKQHTRPSPGVPEGWRIARTHDGIDVHAPDGTSVYVEPKALGDRKMPEEVLHALCSDLLAAAQAKGGE